MTEPDEGSLAAEHERLLEFLYALPIAVADLSLSGDIELMNPRGADLLTRIDSSGAHTNLFRYLEPFEPELARWVSEFQPERGAICTEYRIEARDSLFLALTLVKAGANRILATFRDVTQAVLAERTSELERDEQRAVIRSLSTPVIEAYADTLLVPIVGALDAERAAAISEDLLAAVIRLEAEFVLLDFGGLTEVDEAFVTKLRQISRALSLVGCQCLLAGVTPTMALALSNLDDDLGGLPSFRTVRDAAASLGLHQLR